MNVVMVSRSFDIGGQGSRIVDAFRRHAPGWDVRSMVKDQSFLAYPVDLPYRQDVLEELYQACDVFHARLDFTDYDRLAAKFGPKPVILHGHGTAYRANPNHWAREAKMRNALIIVSTLDLWLLNTEAVWLPAPYDLDWLASM